MRNTRALALAALLLTLATSKLYAQTGPSTAVQRADELTTTMRQRLVLTPAQEPVVADLNLVSARLAQLYLLAGPRHLGNVRHLWAA